MSQNDLSCVLTAIDSLLGDIAKRSSEIENLTLESYLEGMQAWLADYQEKHNEPLTWEFVAKMICAASMYE